MSRASLLVLVSVRMVAAAAALLLVGLVLACGDAEEEELAPANTASPTAATPSASSTPPVTFGPTATPEMSPEDWKTYADPGGLFTIRYPPGWFPVENSISSVDPNTTDKSGYPESVHVEFSVTPDDGYGCGVLVFDVGSGKVSPQPGATESSLGDVPAWKIVREPGDPLLNDPYTRIEAISVIHEGHCFNIAGYFRQWNPPRDLFDRIIGTFEFDL